MPSRAGARTRRSPPSRFHASCLEELFELARWVPTHHLTNPWRFRVIGPLALAKLKEAGGPRDAPKPGHAPTLVAATMVRSGDPIQHQEDLRATGCAVYALLLAALGRGLPGYWRTPGVLRTPEGLRALDIHSDEQFVALIHLGWQRQDKQPPERLPVVGFVRFLD